MSVAGEGSTDPLLYFHFTEMKMQTSQVTDPFRIPLRVSWFLALIHT
jgi:hypothetical protein